LIRNRVSRQAERRGVTHAAFFADRENAKNLKKLAKILKVDLWYSRTKQGTLTRKQEVLE